jgi:hypothetical protein
MIDELTEGHQNQTPKHQRDFKNRPLSMHYPTAIKITNLQTTSDSGSSAAAAAPIPVF